MPGKQPIYAARTDKVDASGLDMALGRVAEIHDETKTSIRDLCWFLQETMHMRILAEVPHDDRTRIDDAYNRGVAHGIEIACLHVADQGQIRAFRDWLHETFDKEGADESGE